MGFRNTEEINNLSEIMLNKENKLIELETDIDIYKYRLKKLANENLSYERILLETLKFEVKNFLEYFNITKDKDMSKLGVLKKQNKVDYVYFTYI